MAQITLGHTSALEYWLKRPSDFKVKQTRSKIRCLPSRELSASLLESLCEDISLVNKPYTLLTANNERTYGANLTCRAAPCSFPNQSFIRADKNVMVASPELCFVQMATLLSFEQLLLLGYSLVGMYAPTPGGADFIQRAYPLTSKQKLESYIDSACNIRGSVVAKRAIRYIRDYSASPMETALTLLLCLPTSYGGYGIPFPKMNEVVCCVNDGLKNKYRCDLLWEKEGVAVEYDSNQWHVGALKINKDAMRRNQIISTGITTITATSNQLYDKLAFEKLAYCIAESLGKRIRIRCNKFPQKQNQLRLEVLHRNKYESFFPGTKSEEEYGPYESEHILGNV